ncbi:glycoside hydrolase family 30 beta sandwich domain-containing protein [Austwickia chelonae]|uniref:glycoside hydrolase family 30 beta sandwich domain-containing protein n=1 Tax=Austwickia chelonae TaxID=100225 RepID=UPI000E25A56C|nr:glycoside hydrolase family 30 beta sandwich domain-containing protein [Austwickia chelonae]
MNRPRTPRNTALRRSPRIAAVGAVGLLVMSGLSGCQWTSPITTQLHYDAGDGKSAEIGAVKILNALIVAEAKDSAGTLAVTLDNQGTDKQTVQIRVGEQSVASVEVPPGKSVQTSHGGKAVRIDKVPAAPGELTSLVFSTESGGSTPVNIPVLLPHADGPYATLKPSGNASTAPSAPATPTSGAPTTSAAPTGEPAKH